MATTTTGQLRLRSCGSEGDYGRDGVSFAVYKNPFYNDAVNPPRQPRMDFGRGPSQILTHTYFSFDQLLALRARMYRNPALYVNLVYNEFRDAMLDALWLPGLAAIPKLLRNDGSAASELEIAQAIHATGCDELHELPDDLWLLPKETPDSDKQARMMRLGKESDPGAIHFRLVFLEKFERERDLLLKVQLADATFVERYHFNVMLESEMNRFYESLIAVRVREYLDLPAMQAAVHMAKHPEQARFGTCMVHGCEERAVVVDGLCMQHAQQERTALDEYGDILLQEWVNCFVAGRLPDVRPRACFAVRVFEGSDGEQFYRACGCRLPRPFDNVPAPLPPGPWGLYSPLTRAPLRPRGSGSFWLCWEHLQAIVQHGNPAVV